MAMRLPPHGLRTGSPSLSSPTDLVPHNLYHGRDGTNLRRLTFEGITIPIPPGHRKGTGSLFVEGWKAVSIIFTIGRDGSGLRRMTSNPGNNESPSWSPDGRGILYLSSERRPADVRDRCTKAASLATSKIFIMNANVLKNSTREVGLKALQAAIRCER